MVHPSVTWPGTHAMRVLGLALLMCKVSWAQVIAPDGCPVFHCTPEATGMMTSSMLGRVNTVKRNNRLGALRYQGCSGDGQRLACLFSSDDASGPARGTLKLIDATTLAPIWGSAGIPNSYDPLVQDTAGQVPLIFADGHVAAGDAAFHVLYNRAGVAVAKLRLKGSGINFGLTPVSPGLAVVSQNDGVLTLVDLVNWRALDVVKLFEPGSGGKITLVAPPAGTTDRIYAVGQAQPSSRGWLFAIDVDRATRELRVRSAFAFDDHSASSPVVVTPSVSGLATPLVLLNVPGLHGDAQRRLLGLVDDGTALSTLWAVAFKAPVPVTPAVDPLSRTWFIRYLDDAHIYQHDVLSGIAIAEFDLQALSDLPRTLALNGHLGSTMDGDVFTLLISASVTLAPGSNGQYEMAFAPIASPNLLVWRQRIATRADTSTAAWNLAPSRRPGVSCPVVVGTSSGITRLCDF